MILSADIARQLRNASLSALYRVAYDHDVDLSDVMASITPSQPSPASQAPAASTPAAAPADVQAEVVPPVASSVDHSDIVPPISTEPQPSSTPAVQAHIVPDGSNVRDERPTSQPGAKAPNVPAPIAGDAQFRDPVDWEDEDGAQLAPMSKKKRVTQRQRVKDCHEQHPDWGAVEIAAELDISSANVWSIASATGIKFVSRKKTTTEALRKAVEAEGPSTEPEAKGQPGRPFAASPEEREAFDKRLIALHRAEPTLIRPRLAERLGVKVGHVNAAVARLELHVPHARTRDDETFVPEIIPPANPQKPVGAAPSVVVTLTEKVAAMHRQHPTWTARLIANELGANADSVSVLLAKVRRKAAGEETEEPARPAPTLPNHPPGEIEAGIRIEAAARRKRLGAPA